MNTRFMCDLCGCQPCLCQTFDCPACDGEGLVEHPHQTERYMIDCGSCDGGEAKCNGPIRGNCPFTEFITGDWMCHCEAAWDRQQEALAAGDGPPTMREQQVQAQRERDALRGGRPL